jgi:hypothetical protein
VKSKIVPNIDTENNNWDYRVVRCCDMNKTSAIIFDSELDTYLRILEIHFGCDGEIIAYALPFESPHGDDLEGLQYEINEYVQACKKPILNMAFVEDQTKRSSRRIHREIAKEMKERKRLEEEAKARGEEEEIPENKISYKSWDEVKKELSLPDWTTEVISIKEAIKRFKLDEYEG